MKTINRTACFTIAFYTAIFLTSADAAGNDVANFGGHTPATDEIVNALVVPKMRGIRPVEPKSVSFELKFEFASARLTGSAKKTLNSLGAALQDDRLKNSNFRIEGHTDAKGSRYYNKKLSEQRAESVKAYLSDNFEVAPAQMETIGMGFEQPLNPTNPKAPENRRVQITNLGAR
jgi:outer membrane protein OmpA-like peptidoglycan-associated protein